MCHHSCGGQKACTRSRRPAQGLMGTQARSVHLAGHKATREHNVIKLCSVYHMFPSMLVIVLLRSTMGALPWSARGSKQRVHVRETKKRRKRARSGRAPRVCAECTFGHTLQHANTTLLLQKICFSCNMFLRMILRTLSSCSNGFPSRGLGMHGRGRPVVECACNSEKQGGNFLHNRQRFSANFGPIILVPIFFCPDFPSFQSFSPLKCAWWDCFRTRVTATLLADRVVRSACGSLLA